MIKLLQKNNYIFLSFLFVFSGCSSKLLKPLKGGISYSNAENGKSEKSVFHGFETGTTIYLKPKGNLIVRAIEDCKITVVLFGKDSSKIIIAKGKFNIGYGNLGKCFVIKGDSVKRGNEIGELFSKDSVDDNVLSISIEKEGKHLIPNW